METIDISKYDKADVLRVLYDASKPQGVAFLHYNSSPMTRDEAVDLMEEFKGEFDYLGGRVMKVLIGDGGRLDPSLYDRDNGQRAAKRAIATLS